MKNRMIITVLCAAFLLGGCAKGVREPDEGDRGQVPFALRAGPLEAAGRAGILDGETSLPVGGSVGIFVVDYTADAPMTWPYAVNGFYAHAQGVLGVETMAGTGQPVSLSPALYYQPGRMHDVFAYYPYDAGDFDYTSSGPVLTAALTSADQYDVITAVPVRGLTSVTAEPANQLLRFGHRLSLMRFSVLKEAAISEPLSLSKIEFTMDRSQTVEVNVSTGAAVSAAGGAAGYEYSPAGDCTLTPTAAPLCKFLFCPGTTITAIALTIDGEVFATPALWQGIAVPGAGSALDVSLTVRPAEITIALGDAGWNDGGGINVSDHTVHSAILLGDGGWNDGGSPVTVGK